MKKFLSILSAALLLCGVGFTSCDNWDEPVTGNAFGNNNIREGRTISIAALKELYTDVIQGDKQYKEITGTARIIREGRTISIAALKELYTDVIQGDKQYKEITGTARIEGVVIGDDETGNIYSQIIVADETGAIVVSVNKSGLYAFTPVGQKVVIDCNGLCIGGYGQQAQLGVPYNGSIGRMPIYVWEQHVRLLGEPKLYYEELKPLVIESAEALKQLDKKNAPLLVTFKGYVWEQHVRLLGEPKLYYEELKPLVIESAEALKQLDKKNAPLLVTFKGVTIPNAESGKVYASEDDKPFDKATFVEHDMKFVDGGACAPLHTSPYAHFADEKLPKGELNVTGILANFKGQWQLVVRTLDDVKRIK